MAHPVAYDGLQRVRYGTALSFHVVSIFAEAGLDRDTAITLFLPAAGVAVLANFIGGWLSDRTTLRWHLALFQVGIILSNIGVLNLHLPWGRYAIIVGSGLMGGMMRLLSTVTWPRYFGSRHLGAVSSFAMAWAIAASAVGPSAFGYSLPVPWQLPPRLLGLYRPVRRLPCPLPLGARAGVDLCSPCTVVFSVMIDIIERIFAIWQQQSHLDYGESVTTVEHMLQCAVFAERDNASTTLIAATVLHDIGHLLHGLPEDIAEQGIDGVHEEVGARWLAENFVPAVTEPTRLHVPAKRYLYAVEPSYFDALSPSSVQSLRLQGGPFTPAEVADFEQLDHWQDAVRLRRYDDMGKIPGMRTPDLAHYRPYLQAGLLP
jgi:gamma-butyrobetaine dioxygenase